MSRSGFRGGDVRSVSQIGMAIWAHAGVVTGEWRWAITNTSETPGTGGHRGGASGTVSTKHQHDPDLTPTVSFAHIMPYRIKKKHQSD